MKNTNDHLNNRARSISKTAQFFPCAFLAIIPREFPLYVLHIASGFFFHAVFIARLVSHKDVRSGRLFDRASKAPKARVRYSNADRSSFKDYQVTERIQCAQPTEIQVSRARPFEFIANDRRRCTERRVRAFIAGEHRTTDRT